MDLLTSHDPTQVNSTIEMVDSFLLASFIFFFFILTFTNMKANYGRYTTSALGYTVPGIIDWYMHCTSLIAVAIAITKDNFNPRTDPRSFFLLAMFSVHYFYRSFIFAKQMDQDRIKPIPVAVMLSGSGFCFVNGLANARYLTLLAHFPKEDVFNIQFIIGATIWALGFFGNVWHDRRLIKLKREAGGKYVIPTGGLFDYISGANFFSEICEWFGFALACGFSTPSTTFFICTFANIGPRAFHHHQYYLEKFSDYPKSRKALIPFIC